MLTFRMMGEVVSDMALIEHLAFFFPPEPKPWPAYFRTRARGLYLDLIRKEGYEALVYDCYVLYHAYTARECG